MVSRFEVPELLLQLFVLFRYPPVLLRQLRILGLELLVRIRVSETVMSTTTNKKQTTNNTASHDTGHGGDTLTDDYAERCTVTRTAA
jgi:hypothetical protein